MLMKKLPLYFGQVYTPTSKPAGLLKFQRTSSSTEAQSTTTTGYSSLNDSSDYPETLSIYTETKLPPRLIRKYQSRARTEALIMNHLDATQSSSLITEDLKQSDKCNNNDTNSDTGSGSGMCWINPNTLILSSFNFILLLKLLQQ